MKKILVIALTATTIAVSAEPLTLASARDAVSTYKKAERLMYENYHASDPRCKSIARSKVQSFKSAERQAEIVLRLRESGETITHYHVDPILIRLHDIIDSFEQMGCA